MADEIKVKLGKKAEKSAADPSKTAKTTPTPGEGSDVQGQYVYERLWMCPWCGGVSYINYDTDAYHWYECCHCGNLFQA